MEFMWNSEPKEADDAFLQDSGKFVIVCLRLVLLQYLEF
jgi:hypothetical protein